MKNLARSKLAPTDAEILALNRIVEHFSESPSRYPEAGHGTQYHAGAPGVLSFARAVLAKWGAPAPASGEPVAIYRGRCVIDCGEHGHHDIELLKMIPAGSNLYTAPPAQEARVPLSDAQKREMVAGYFSEDWAIENALHLLDDFERHGITAAQKETP